MNREREAAMTLAGLAHRRYPDMDLLLAIECFRSDRQRAGMGALDVNKRRGGGREISRVKRVNHYGEVQYKLAFSRPAREAWTPQRFELGAEIGPESTITMELVPAKQRAVGLHCFARDLFDQGMRSVIAAELRVVRRSLESAHEDR